MDPLDPILEALRAKIEDTMMKRTRAVAPEPCQHSRNPEWENTLWLVAAGELPWEEEERLIGELEACPYCRHELTRCMASELRARRLSPGGLTGASQMAGVNAAGRLFRLVVERVAHGFRCLEEGWQALQPAAAAVRGSGSPAEALFVTRSLLHFDLEVCLSPTPESRTQLALAVRDRETGAPIDGHAELRDHAGGTLESVPIRRGQGRFRPVAPGTFWIVVVDQFGLSEMLEVVVQ